MTLATTETFSSVRVLEDSDGPYFVFESEGRDVEVRVDFEKRAGVGLKTDLLARSLGWKRGSCLRVVDATAGLARDTAHLLQLDCQVLAIEKNKTLFQVVSERARRAKLSDAVEFRHGDASAILRAAGESWDVVYLDPMFPEKKTTAKSGKETELLKLLEAPPSAEDEAALLNAALHVAPRVVVKRPPHAPPLSDRKPQAEFSGKAVRYDVYFQISQTQNRSF